MTILIIDDEEGFRSGIRKVLELSGWSVVEVSNGEQARKHLNRREVEIVLIDRRLGSEDGIDLIRELKRVHPAVSFVMVTGFSDVRGAVEAMQAGASNYVSKPIDSAMLNSILSRELESIGLRRENRALRNRLVSSTNPVAVNSSNPKMQAVEDIISRVAATDASALIVGETGTGKEIVARRIHAQGKNPQAPFVGINCAAVNEGLLESELFGHERGAFTGAVQVRKGRFEQAAGGTLFLDELGEMSLTMQAKLLRVLEERSYERLGGAESHKVSCRILAATNRDLSAAIKEGRFREDLYFRLAIVRIELPPLRNRKEDLPALTRLFLENLAELYGRQVPLLSAHARVAIASYDWPGNIRELKNVLAKALMLSDGDEIRSIDLPDQSHVYSSNGHVHEDKRSSGISRDESLRGVLDREVMRLESRIIDETLRECAGNVSHAAAKLKLSRKTLYEKMKIYGL